MQKGKKHRKRGINLIFFSCCTFFPSCGKGVSWTQRNWMFLIQLYVGEFLTQPKPCNCRILDCRKLNHSTLKSYVNVSPGRVHVHVSCPRSIIFRIARMSTKSGLSHLTHMGYPSSGNLNYFMVDIYTHPYIHAYIHACIPAYIHTYIHTHTFYYLDLYLQFFMRSQLAWELFLHFGGSYAGRKDYNKSVQKLLIISNFVETDRINKFTILSKTNKGYKMLPGEKKTLKLVKTFQKSLAFWKICWVSI